MDNPFDDFDVGFISTPTFVDIDGDGDLDLVSGAVDGTFKVYLQSPLILAVDLTDLNVQLDHGYPILNWSTETETNSLGFAIEHSTTGIDWANIGWLDGAGDSTNRLSYSFIHDQPKLGQNYYRLQHKDIDGTTLTTNVVQIEVLDSPQLTIYPNPVSNQLFIKGIDSIQSVTIYSLNGQVALYQNQPTQPITVSQLQKGQYILSIDLGNRIIHRKIMVK